MDHEITPAMETGSRWGPANPTYYWHWQEIELPGRVPTGISGRLRATTESEALARLREAFPQVKAIEWIKPTDYQQLVNKPGPEEVPAR